MSLRKKATQGVFWSSMTQVGTQGISFMVSIVLARLLLPEEFGLIGMIAVFIAIGRILVDSGIGQSLIRSARSTQKEYTSAFYFNLIASIVICGFFYVGAPIVGDFYNQPILANIVQVYSVIFLINAFGLVQYTLLIKNLNFKAELLINLPGLIGGAMVGISMAMNGYGVWSLVWSAIAEAIIRNILLWHHSGWRPSGLPSWKALRPHLKFGVSMGASGLVDTIFTNIYPILIGKYFNPVQVGYYNRSDTFKQFPINNISSVLNKVSYPVFAAVSHDNQRLRKGYRSLMHMVIFLVAPLMLFQICLAEPLFRLLFTEKWLPAVPFFQVLCLNGLLYPIHAYNLNVLKVKGRSDLFLKAEIYKKIVMAGIILVSIWFGIMALLWGAVLSSIIAFVINTHFSSKFIDFSTMSQVKELLPYVIAASLCAGVIYVLDQKLVNSYLINDFIRLVIGTGIGLIIYLILTVKFNMPALHEMKNLFRK